MLHDDDNRKQLIFLTFKTEPKPFGGFRFQCTSSTTMKKKSVFECRNTAVPQLCVQPISSLPVLDAGRLQGET